MDKISLLPDDSSQPVDFYIVEETKLGGKTYLLVTDTEEGDGEALILRDDANENEVESLYTVVEDDRELSAVLMLFKDSLEELGIELEDEE